MTCQMKLVSYCMLLRNAISVQTDPDNEKVPEFDWWSKYYYSIKDERRTQQEYVDQGHDELVVSTGVVMLHVSLYHCSKVM